METGISIGGSPVSVGERFVYPNGGICKVQGLERKTIAGRDLRMLILEREEDRARVMVPEEKVGSIGLRKVASAEDISLLFEFFASSSVDPELDWKVRQKENVVRLVAGGLLDTARVLKGLHALSRIRPLPQREREMYDHTRHQLVREIAASLSVPPAVAENNIDYALTPPPGSGRVAPKDAPIDLKALRRVLGGRKISLGGEELDLEGQSGESENEEGADLFGDLGGGEAEGEGVEETVVAGNEDEEAPVVKAQPKAATSPRPVKTPAPKAPVAPAAVKPMEATMTVEVPAKTAAVKKAPTAKAATAKSPAKPAKAPAVKAKPASKTATASKKPAAATSSVTKAPATKTAATKTAATRTAATKTAPTKTAPTKTAATKTASTKTASTKTGAMKTAATKTAATAVKVAAKPAAKAKGTQR